MACLKEHSPRWWRGKGAIDRMRQERGEHQTFAAIAAAHPENGCTTAALRKAWGDLGGEALPQGPRTALPSDGAAHDDAWLLAALKKAGDAASVDELANIADVAPRRVLEAAERLGVAGFRVEHAAGQVVLERVPPEGEHLHRLSPALFDGQCLRVGAVSDTHLGANEEALEELHLAYDIFEREGVQEVWHAGDWGTGVGMFRTHHAEAHVHTGPEQVDYLVANYPQRKGIVTRGVGGNHDLEGDCGRLGFDPARAFANLRDDIEYLGEYDAWIELVEGTGSWVNLRHGSGGMSYAFSYKAQKMVDSYTAGRKPAIAIYGHWHVRGDFEVRNVKTLFPGCFEWQSRFMKRLGLQPAVGFHIITMTVADDGSVVRWLPEWFPFYQGRRVAA